MEPELAGMNNDTGDDQWHEGDTIMETDEDEGEEVGEVEERSQYRMRVDMVVGEVDDMAGDGIINVADQLDAALGPSESGSEWSQSTPDTLGTPAQTELPAGPVQQDLPLQLNRPSTPGLPHHKFRTGRGQPGQSNAP